jgi:5-methylcytosine-specific restriction endonuclease McrA
MQKYKNYSDEDIKQYAAEVTSLASLLKKLGLKPVGGNYANMKRKLQQLNIDTSHWTGQAWRKNQQLKDWSEYTRAVNLKKHLIKERGHQCEKCKNTTWLDQPITLEVHHISGNKTDNNLINLQLLCPNCHALTDSWRKH